MCLCSLCSVAGNAISFDLASRGTALTLRLRDSFQPLTYGLSPAFLAAPAQRSLQHMILLYFGSESRSLHRYSRRDLLETLGAHICCRTLSTFFAIFKGVSAYGSCATLASAHDFAVLWGSAEKGLYQIFLTPI